MRMNDYRMSSEADKTKWLDNCPITVGLRYFGGKSRIGKYLLNRICNMAVRMDDDGKKPDILIDGFTGGGKIGLSIPEGWFDEIVINDLDYGVVCFYRCCKDSPQALVEMIEELGENMNETFFKFCAYNRSNKQTLQEPKKLKEKEKNQLYVSKERVDPLLAGAMTYWVTKLDFFGKTDPASVDYRVKKTHAEKDVAEKDATEKDVAEKDSAEKRAEQEIIRNTIEFARKAIPEISRILRKKNITIEYLDYRELIKKYNGKPYKNVAGEEQCAEEALGNKNKLWYFDPPYHPDTVSNKKGAPYEETFTIEKTKEMVEILHNNQQDTYGKLEYFIKSDYNPKYLYQYEKISENAIHDFDILEENDSSSKHFKEDAEEIEYYVECIGEFPTGGVDEDGSRIVGREYVWCRGNYQCDNRIEWKWQDT